MNARAAGKMYSRIPSADTMNVPPAWRVALVVVITCAVSVSSATAAASDSIIGELKRLNVEDLMNLEVTSAARRPEKLLDAAAAMQVITRTDMGRSGAATLSESLRLADNLQVAQRGSQGWAVSARGFNTDLANKLLVIIDGRTVYTPLFSGVYWEAQDYLLEDVDRIEVISGPGGALWGANAVNGVINVITRSALRTPGLYVEGGGGSELNAFMGLRYGGSITPGVGFRIYGKYLERGSSVRADATPASDSWRRMQTGFRIDSEAQTDHKLTVQGDYYSNDMDASTRGITGMQGANILGRWTYGRGDDSELSLQAYYDWTHIDDVVAPVFIGSTQLAPAGRLQDDLHTIDLDFQHRFDLGSRHRLNWGLGFRNTHDAVQNAPGLAFLPAVLTQQLYSLFLQDDVRLQERLSLILGTKVEHNDYTGWEFEPSLRLQWQVGATQTVWGGISRAIRAPSRVDRDLVQPAPPYLTILRGDAAFRSEEVLAYELGYRAQVGERLTTSMATFYNVYDDVRSTNITLPRIVPFFFQNNLAGHTWGLEIAGDMRIAENWSLHFGYNLLREDLHVKSGQFDLSNARNETADPEHQVALRSSLDLPGRVAVDASLRWVDTLHNSNGPTPGNVPAYIDLNLRVAWQASDALELSVAGQNLLHDHHPEYGFTSPLRTEVQRGVHGKLTWRR